MVHFTHGENTTTFKILGLGTLQIGPDEYISTDNVQISYFDEIITQKEIVVHRPELNLTNFELREKEFSNIPTLNGTEWSNSVFDKKQLFDLGIDVQEIKKHRTVLQNIIYAPLENPWITTTSIAVMGGLIAIFLFCFRGEISCCARKISTERRKDRDRLTKRDARRRQLKLNEIEMNDIKRRPDETKLAFVKETAKHKTRLEKNETKLTYVNETKHKTPHENKVILEEERTVHHTPTLSWGDETNKKTEGRDNNVRETPISEIQKTHPVSGREWMREAQNVMIRW